MYEPIQEDRWRDPHIPVIVWDGDLMTLEDACAEAGLDVERALKAIVLAAIIQERCRPGFIAALVSNVDPLASKANRINAIVDDAVERS
jgi:hypothetical protein